MSPDDVFRETCYVNKDLEDIHVWRVVPGRYIQLSREKPPLEASNFHVAERLLMGVDPEGKYHQCFYEVNPFTGRVELLTIRDDAPEDVVKVVADIITSLDNYCALDETDWSKREHDAAEEAYDPWDLRRELAAKMPPGTTERLSGLMVDSDLDPRDVLPELEWEYTYEGDHPYYAFRVTEKDAHTFAIAAFRARRR